MPEFVPLNGTYARLSRMATNVSAPQQEKKTGRPAMQPGEQDPLKKACVEMESVFMHQLLKEMRATIPDSGLTGSKSIKEMYTHMTDAQFARTLSHEGGIGLADILFRQLSRGVENGGAEVPKKND